MCHLEMHPHSFTQLLLLITSWPTVVTHMRVGAPPQPYSTCIFTLNVIHDSAAGSDMPAPRYEI